MNPSDQGREWLDTLWMPFAKANPQADRIHRLLRERGEQIINDHIALRTWDFPGYTLDDLAKPFLAAGYREAGHYRFVEKHLIAKHWQHPDTSFPKIFISQLEWQELSPGAQSILLSLRNQATPDENRWLCNSGRSWNLSWVEYETLARESEYAAWLAAWGFIANHFTVAAHALRTFADLRQLNDYLESQGFVLNAAGGKIKGSPGEFLEQSSTLAAPSKVPFAEGIRKIPGCYYEFAWRHPMPHGELFHGFLEQSANRIFESTHRNRNEKGS